MTSTGSAALTNGFTFARSDGSPMNRGAMEEAISDLVSQINAETGYLD
jgi:hypothetical protein